MVEHKAQDVASKPRTEDVQISEDIDFKSMLLPNPILQGLQKSGYIKPSPIQKRALPLVRCGLDLIVQAKAGTGKTCVFTVAALELVVTSSPRLQAIVLAPTREIAQQITEVISTIGQAIPGLNTSCFIGGYPISLDASKAAGCHIAVGAPGRMRHLIEKGLLDPTHVRLFVLDEADKLMEKAFLNDINMIFSHLPQSKQVLACSATFTSDLKKFLSCYMYRGQYVTPDLTSGASSTVLVGIRQFVSILTHHVDKLAQLRLKEKHLLYLLCSIRFNQCLIFSNIHSRAVSLCNMLRGQGWSAEWIAGRQDQADRVIALSQLKEQRVRVLVSTDLTARGIDVENVNLIINLDIPIDHHTYLHRMGRAGRYGSHGMVITVVSSSQELIAFQKHLGAIGGTSLSVSRVPEELKNVDLWTASEDDFEKVHGIVEPKIVKPRKRNSSKNDKQEGSAKAKEKICQKSNGSTVRLLERTNEFQESTDTDEKFSQESSSSEEFENICFGNVDRIDHKGTKAEKETGNKCEEDTETDEKCSEKSSDELESAVIFESDKQNVSAKNISLCKDIPARNICSCDLFDVQQKDIEVISGPSIYCVSEWEGHWHKDFGVVVRECKIPLNTPLILLDSKVVIVKSVLGNVFQTESYDVDNCADQVISFETKRGTENFYSIEEIESMLESGTVDFKINSKGTLEKEVFSFNEIREFLDSDANESKFTVDSGNENSFKYEEIATILKSYQNCRRSLENYLGTLNCFDIVGWMAVDDKHNILESLKIKQFEIFEFVLVKCPTGNNHIQVTSIKDAQDIKRDVNTSDRVSTFDLKALNLTAPLTLVDIVEKLSANRKHSGDHNNVNVLKEVKENGLEKSVEGFRHNVKGGKIETPIKQTRMQVRTKKSSKVNMNKKSSVDECRGKFTQLSIKPKCRPTTILNGKGKTHVKSNKNKVTLKSKNNVKYSSLQSEHFNPCATKDRYQQTSTSSEDSDHYIDMSQSLMKWHVLHDFDESDSGSSEESDVLLPSGQRRVRVTSSDSSDVSANKQMEKQGKQEQNIASETVLCESLESETSYKGFETASERRNSGTRTKIQVNKRNGHFQPSTSTAQKACNGDGHLVDDDTPFEYRSSLYCLNPSTSKMSQRNTLSANNLHSEWYSSWYAQVRQVAKQLEISEYTNTMSNL